MSHNPETVRNINHRWKFFRYGGIDQVSLETGADLLALDKLDPKLWAAMTCPVDNMEFDAKTLEYLDSDKDRRIKIAEILAALKWISPLLKNLDVLINSGSSLPLDCINTENKEGASLLASAKQILKNLGKADADSISVEDLADTKKIFAATACNGDGIVTPDSATSETTRQLLREIIDCIGSETDRSGLPGVSEKLLNNFINEISAFAAWSQQARDGAAQILFAGEGTHAQAAHYKAIEGKIDDFFTRCQLASFDENYATAAQTLEKDYIALLKKSLNNKTEELKEFPLSLVNKEMLLPLFERINPAWQDELQAFSTEVIKPHIGDTTTLSQKQWLSIKEKFRPYKNWENRKAGSNVARLGEPRINEILKNNTASEVMALIARDKAVEAEFNAITSVDKLIRYYCHLYHLLNNFVSFRDFYNVRKKAVFQAGTLYMDSRSCDLCIKVMDVGKHSTMAASCNTFLAYCDCIKQGSTEKMSIAAAFTDGDSDQLLPGRNGMFVDRHGNYWEATITRIIDHPISIRQAFWAPYKRLGRMINEQIEKFASDKDKSATDFLANGVTQTGLQVNASTPVAPPVPFDIGKFAGIFAAISLAAAAAGSAVPLVVSGLMNLLWWQMPLAIAGILLLISGPSMLLAGLRLRQRNLGPILDANGWAVNTRAQINMKFGKTLTSIAKLPKGSLRSMDDPFAEKQTPWKLYLALILIIAGAFFFIFNPEARERVSGLMHKFFRCSGNTPEAKCPTSAVSGAGENAIASDTTK